MVKDQDRIMWDYWRDKYGHVDALETYYPESLATHIELQQAVYSIKSAKALIDKFFEN